MPKQELYLGTLQLAASYLGTVASTIYDKEVDNTPKSATFITFSGYTADASAYTMTQTLSAGNYVIVAHYEAGSDRTLNSIQFSGSTGTSNATISSGGYFNGSFVQMSYINLTNSTTYNITTNYSGTVLRAGIGLYRLNNVNSIVPNLDGSIGYIESAPGGSSSITGTACCWGAGLGVIIAASTTTAATTATYTTPGRTTNITEDYDSIVESNAGFSSANLYGVDANTTQVRVTFGSSAICNMVSLTWI